MKSPWLRMLFSTSLLIVGTVPSARADYAMPDAAEQYRVLANNWSIAGDTLTITRGGKPRTFAIDRFWLADRVCSDSICTGSDKKETQKYLDDLKTLPKGTGLQVELANKKPGEKLFVSGIWKSDPTNSFKKASQFGSRLLNLTAVQVQKLGSQEAYTKQVVALSDKSWKLVDAHN